MQIEVLKSKIHCATITEANLHYMGSITKGERGSGCVCLNGAAARKAVVGDTVIIISYAMMDFEEAKKFKPSVIFPKEGNAL